MSNRKSLSKLLLSGSSALGTATLIERGLGFVANMVAARLAGAQVFGAYSMAMTTANNVASYAGAGIGTTSNRFSGDYPYDGVGYRGLVRTLSLVSVCSAIIAIILLWLCAEPLAVGLLHNPGIVNLLKISSLSAGAIILLECLRGLLIGQRRFLALLALSGMFGIGMVVALPLASKVGPIRMVTTQSVVAVSAVAICVALAGQLQFKPPKSSSAEENSGPSAWSIMRFGFVQLTAMIGLNAAGWWVASMVARSDVSLIQTGWFSIAMQLRNVSAMPPWLISQTAYAQLTDGGGEGYGGPERVTILSTIAAALMSVAIAGPLAAVMPWIIPLFYGKAFAGAEFAATLAVATGLIHMTAAPAAARLTIISLGLTGLINGAWSILLIVFGVYLVTNQGAAQGVACFLGAHLFSALAVLVALSRVDVASRDLISVTLLALSSSVGIGLLSWLRMAGTYKLELSGLILVVSAVAFALILRKARQISPTIRDLRLSNIASALLSRKRTLVRVAE